MPRSAPKTQSRGALGEELACEYLENKGYRLLARNWSCKAGELDLVMRQGNEIVFVEVRLRRATTYGVGLETVAWQKQRKLIRAAQWYLAATNQQHLSARFDVISIEHEENKIPIVYHIESAFEVI